MVSDMRFPPLIMYYLMALQSKKTLSKNNNTKKQVIKVNPYENPDNVLDLMAKICSARPSVETDIYWNILTDAYTKVVRGASLEDYLRQNRKSLYNPDFEHQLNDLCRKVSWNIQTRENTEHTQIVVAGGFSSGKSSFLNKLTKCTNLLPTGVEPVSVVKTYLYCSNGNKKVTVQGVNQKNVLVSLDPGVLQAIQHAKQSNIYLASVLEKLFVEIPSKELDGLVFIDTPGYNNTDKNNESNGKTDKQTAIEALGEGNVLFWLIDCERGTTVTDDLEMIKQFNGKKVFIFNKADKKGEIEAKKIVEAAATTLYNEFPKEDIIDIIAYSTLEERIYYSHNKLMMSSIIQTAKKSGNGVSELYDLKEDINFLFEAEIQVSKNTIKDIEDAYRKKVEEKNTFHDHWQRDKEDNVSFIEAINEIAIDSYNNVLDAANNLRDYADYAFSNWLDFHEGVLNFENNDHWGHSSILDRAINKSANSFNSQNKKFYNYNWNYLTEEYRHNILDIIREELEKLNNLYKEWYDEANESCNNLLENKAQEELIIADMTEYQKVFMAALSMAINAYQSKDRATNVDSDENEIPNVFECIRKDDYKSFLRSFEEGVDLNICDASGYNPLTLAVSMGNNAMVQFLLDNDADPSILDKRGYNAFHTAVENQFRDICTILLDNDPDLIEIKTAAGESVDDLANKHTFTKWLQTEINNAF